MKKPGKGMLIALGLPSKGMAKGEHADEESLAEDEAELAGAEAEEDAEDVADADHAALGDELASAIKAGDGAAIYRAVEGLVAACGMSGES